MFKTTVLLVAVTGTFVGCATSNANQAPTTGSREIQEEVRSLTAIPKPFSEDEVQCILKADSRKLQIERKPTSCSLTYTKSGKAERILSSATGPQQCVQTLSQIRDNLQASGFHCE